MKFRSRFTSQWLLVIITTTCKIEFCDTEAACLSSIPSFQQIAYPTAMRVDKRSVVPLAAAAHKDNFAE